MSPAEAASAPTRFCRRSAWARPTPSPPWKSIGPRARPRRSFTISPLTRRLRSRSSPKIIGGLTGGELRGRNNGINHVVRAGAFPALMTYASVPARKVGPKHSARKIMSRHNAEPYQTVSVGTAGAAENMPRPKFPGYEVLSELGRGGMGVVYLARQQSLKRQVALKVVRSGSHASARERARFRTEAEAVARLQHANIVQIYEIGEHEGVPYLALE